MSVLDIKNDLLRLMVETNDAELLDRLRNYFKILKKEPVSQEEIEAKEERMIEMGLQQIKTGNTISHEETRKRIKSKIFDKFIHLVDTESYLSSSASIKFKFKIGR